MSVNVYYKSTEEKHAVTFYKDVDIIPNPQNLQENKE